jgi:hypothetical protein
MTNTQVLYLLKYRYSMRLYLSEYSHVFRLLLSYCATQTTYQQSLSQLSVGDYTFAFNNRKPFTYSFL